jgi:hypothetical protein
MAEVAVISSRDDVIAPRNRDTSSNEVLEE